MKRYPVLILVLTFALFAFANNKITDYDEPGLEKSCTIQRLSDYYFYDTNSSAFADSPAASDAALDLTEGAGVALGCYEVNMPAAANEPDDFVVRIYDCNAAIFDPNFTLSGGFERSWDGSDWITNHTIYVKADAIAADVNGLDGAAMVSEPNNTDIAAIKAVTDDLPAFQRGR